jgi:hypothetical protein
VIELCSWFRDERGFELLPSQAQTKKGEKRGETYQDQQEAPWASIISRPSIIFVGSVKHRSAPSLPAASYIFCALGEVKQGSVPLFGN